MKTITDGPGDSAVSFDAFKLARHGGARASSWTVAPLTPWAAELLVRHAETIPPHKRPQWRRHSRTDRIIGVSFATRGDALVFLKCVEETGEKWA